MNEKKIYKQLRKWFPELKQHPLPKKKYRAKAEHFLAWLNAQENEQTFEYLIALNIHQYLENGLATHPVFQHMITEIEMVQAQIQSRADPILKHYEQFEHVIGRFYRVQDQILEIILDEIYKFLKSQNFALLLLWGEEHYWLAVPNQSKKIEAFCALFNQQFDGAGLTVEKYQPSEMSWSI
ncbi:hypothetical protein ACNAUY_10595 [Acinetobacter tibetensis]|uniref:Uncharacterized protein n=1 Tax=Acinetobacter tibetensis TaxID=2943497 RepID=A0AAE9LNV1_9GAMM|nr:hypothetical protein [Acinetobacter tibetensis]USE81909.1 hypothetical protein M5E07_08720 [Acinetobacter tibetensis]